MSEYLRSRAMFIKIKLIFNLSEKSLLCKFDYSVCWLNIKHSYKKTKNDLRTFMWIYWISPAPLRKSMTVTILTFDVRNNAYTISNWWCFLFQRSYLLLMRVMKHHQLLIVVWKSMCFYRCSNDITIIFWYSLPKIRNLKKCDFYLQF